MEKEVYKVLEYERIREMLAERAGSSLGKERARALVPSTEFDEVEKWQEETAEMKLVFQLNYTDEARKMMDARMILTDDVIDVMKAYRETGEAVLDSESGLLIARKRVGNATFWVKFTQEGEDAYTVHRAYSHRMQVVKREG